MTATQKYARRPKWARKLTQRQYSALAKCQGRTPSLARLRADLEYQRLHNFKCWNCRSAGLTLQLPETQEQK